MADAGTERFLTRYENAKKKRDLVASWLDDAYEFALPLRERTIPTGDGRPRTENLFDSTAPIALQDFASQQLDDVWPTDSRPFDLLAGPEAQEGEREAANRLLAGVADDIILTVNNSNFRAAGHEAMQDNAIGTGILMVEEGDAIDPIRCEARPLTATIMDTGPYNNLDAFFFPRKVKVGQIQVIWPKATLTEELARDARENPDKEIEVVEGVERDYSVKGTEAHSYRCVDAKSKHVFVEDKYQGQGSCPVIAFSYTRVAGEVLGRGPTLLALPDIKTLNLVKQLELEAADIRISGLWQAEDDGVVNPATIQIVPGTIIPKARGSKGLESIAPSGDIGLAQLIVEELQNSIRRVHNGDDLGPPTGTPMSAQEVIQRTVNRAKRQAGPAARLVTELLFPLVRRVAYIRKKQGRIKLPVIDGRTIVLRPLAPITRAQALDEILRHDRYVEMMNARFGPQLTAMMLDGEKYAGWLAEKMGVTPTLMRPTIERKQLAQTIAQLSATGAAA